MNSDHKLEKIELVEIENGYRVFLRKNIVKSKNETNDIWTADEVILELPFRDNMEKYVTDNFTELYSCKQIKRLTTEERLTALEEELFGDTKKSVAEKLTHRYLIGEITLEDIKQKQKSNKITLEEFKEIKRIDKLNY